MARIEFSPLALAQLDRMIELYALPDDTRGRVGRCVAHLANFPDSGAPLGGRWDGFRMVLGPWSWLLIVCKRVSDELVAVVAVEDARTGAAATTQRPAGTES